MNTLQEIWNNRIHSAGKHANRFSKAEMLDMAREGGEFWLYQQSPHNTDAYREGWERTFGDNKEK